MVSSLIVFFKIEKFYSSNYSKEKIYFYNNRYDINYIEGNKYISTNCKWSILIDIFIINYYNI